MTGKQAEFTRQYLGPCRFNATAAAKAAGYRANSQHSFEEIGSQNLQKPEIRRVIDEHFKLSRMSAEEVLIEISELARGDSKDKIKALALLSSHHGLLDHSWRAQELEKSFEERVEQRVKEQWDEITRDLERDVNDLNQKGLDIFTRAKEKFKDKPDAMAFCDYYYALLDGKEPQEPTTEIEIIPLAPIPQQRRLQPAAVERMMQAIEPEIVEPLPQERCKHGCLEGECRTIELGADGPCPHHYTFAPKQSRGCFVVS